ncbi:MAG: hypothetical protein GX455_13090 [Phycisphaerae bacterium]|nr:hypothetical protein [Phycisphaerae bacterium]
MIELCRQAASINLQSSIRRGNVLYLPDSGRVVFAGDIHGHRRNFERTVAFADLAARPDTHLILHEILHGGPEDELGGCLSFQLYEEVLRLQIQFPQQVHLLLGNHDTAVINDTDVMKCGKEMNQAMKAAMKRHFAEEFEDTLQAMRDYLVTQPLAARAPNRIWMSHSLPEDRYLDKFDPGILGRTLTPEDCRRGNSGYLMTWGRHHGEATLEKIAQMLDADYFLLGHQPQPSGWHRGGKNLLILASDHNHGCIISFELDKLWRMETLIDRIVPLASIE